MLNSNKTVKELNVEFELLAERVKKLEEKNASEDSGKVQEKLNGIEEILEKFKRAPEEGREVQRLFDQMDGDANESIDREEYMSYWKDVMAKGKPVEQISAQLDRLLDKADFADQCGTAFQLAAKV